MSLIRNTNGNTWAPVGANVQLAIDDLIPDGGTVWVGSNVTLTQPIMPRYNTTVDFLNKKVTLANDASFCLFHGNSASIMRYATVRNAFVLPTATHTAPIIHMYAGQVWAERNMFNLVENITIWNTGPYETSQGYLNHNFDGILCENQGTRGLHNTFRKIQMNGVNTGIHHYVGNAGWNNGFYFEDIYIEGAVNGIWFDKLPTSTTDIANENVFTCVRMQTLPWTLYGVRNISGSDNKFIGCLIWDWYGHGGSNPYDWIITNQAAHTTIISDYVNLIDNGIKTVIVTQKTG